MSQDLTLFLAQNDLPGAAPGAPSPSGPAASAGAAPAAGAPSAGTATTGAPASHPPADNGFFGAMGMPILLIGIYLAYLVWDNSRKAKKREAAVKELKKGDTVYTHGGIIGNIFEIDGTETVLKLEDGQKVRLLRSSIAGAYEAGKATV